VKSNLQYAYDPDLSLSSTANSQAQTPQPSGVVLGASTPRTPNPSSSRPPAAPGVFPAVRPLPAGSIALLSPSQEAVGERTLPTRLPAGLFPRMCLCRTKIGHEIVYRNPRNHPRISYHTPITTGHVETVVALMKQW
jgi:hypothetical protein